MAEIKCLPFKKVWLGPLFGQPEGTLTALDNMRIRPGGYAEMRGGIERLKPSGGTPTNPISTGGITAGIELATANGWIRNFSASAGAGTQYSKNVSMDQGFLLFGALTVNDAIYFGCDFTFSRISVLLSVVAGAGGTKVYEYWNGSSWTSLTTTETITWTSTAQQYASWVVPTDWAATAVGDSGTGNVYKFWMRIRVTVISAAPDPSAYFAFGYWPGMREIYIASSDPRTAVAAGKLMRYGQSGTTSEWFAVDSALFSGTGNPHRMATYRGRVFLVNGKDQKRWDGAYFADIGLPKLTNTFTGAYAVGVGLGAGVWRYYAAWGYGPAQDCTTAQPCDPQSLYGVGQATLTAPAAVADPADANSIITAAGGVTERVTLTLVGSPPAGALALHLYRTQDLTNVPISSRATMPAFLIASKRVTSVTVLEGGAAYTDQTLGNLYPPVEAVLYDNLPPQRSKFVAVYQNRLFLGTDTRWYWSDAFKPDVYYRAINYIDLTRAFGGRNMGGVEFADQMVLFTEDQVWGLTNVDLDVPQLYPIYLGDGCVAPDSIAVGDGRICWLGRRGFYSWDGGREGPKLVSGDLSPTIDNMNFETHGGTSACIHDSAYDARLAAPGLTASGATYSYDFTTGAWSTLTFSVADQFPLCSVNAPLSHADVGVPHPLYAKRLITTSATDVYLGEYGTVDNALSYSATATAHFPMAPRAMFKPSRVIAYFVATSGWATPAFSSSSGATDILGSSHGTVNTNAADTGADYSLVTGTFSSVSGGTSDLKVTFTVASSAGGTANRQSLHGMVLEGEYARIRRGR